MSLSQIIDSFLKEEAASHFAQLVQLDTVQWGEPLETPFLCLGIQTAVIDGEAL